MRLDQVKRGQSLPIVSILNDKIRPQTNKFGLAEGTVVNCYENIPGGPVVVKNNKFEIAIGRRAASQIEVKAIT